MSPEEIAGKILSELEWDVDDYVYLKMKEFRKVIREAIELHEASKKQLPEYGKPVIAKIRHYHSYRLKQVDLVRVEEDDCVWRFTEDNCELSHEWEVIYWQYAPEVTNGN